MFSKVEIQPLTQIIIFNKVDSSHISVICLWKSEPALHSQGSIQQLERRAPFSGRHLLDDTHSEFKGFPEKSEHWVFMLVLPCPASSSCYIPGSVPPTNMASLLKKYSPLSRWTS